MNPKDDELRDVFAGLALVGLLAGGGVKMPYQEGYQDGPSAAAARAYRFADALLTERAKRTLPPEELRS